MCEPYTHGTCSWPARLNALTGEVFAAGAPHDNGTYTSGSIEMEDYCGDKGDFTVGLTCGDEDSEECSTKWGQDDYVNFCGLNQTHGAGGFFVWWRERRRCPPTRRAPARAERRRAASPSRSSCSRSHSAPSRSCRSSRALRHRAARNRRAGVGRRGARESANPPPRRARAGRRCSTLASAQQPRARAGTRRAPTRRSTSRSPSEVSLDATGTRARAGVFLGHLTAWRRWVHHPHPSESRVVVGVDGFVVGHPVRPLARSQAPSVRRWRNHAPQPRRRKRDFMTNDSYR